MGIHQKVDGLRVEGVAEAHRKDVAVQGKRGVDSNKYWFNPPGGELFSSKLLPGTRQ